jgi:ATP-dependent DNA helicase RecQ
VDKTRLCGAVSNGGTSGGAEVIGAPQVENPGVFAALRSWRRDMAKEHGVPAYTIFHDSTLRELAGRLPGSLDELRGISGIGATKLERYGSALLDVMQRAAQ